jgi:predicted small integral membrane protein
MTMLQDLLDKLAWMAWTWQTGLFFGTVALVLVIMTVLAVKRPEKPRPGIFRFATTRGDRLFMSLLGSAFIYILWFRFGTEAIWPPAIIALLFATAMFRFA